MVWIGGFLKGIFVWPDSMYILSFLSCIASAFFGYPFLILIVLEPVVEIGHPFLRFDIMLPSKLKLWKLLLCGIVHLVPSSAGI